jgi:hypothetical protein
MSKKGNEVAAVLAAILTGKGKAALLACIKAAILTYLGSKR